MRDIFNLVRGAVSEKDLIPVLTHFAYCDGRLHGYNGRIHISAPLKLPDSVPSFTVPATLFMAAMDACEGNEPELTVVDHALCILTTGLRNRQHPFEAYLPIGTIAEFPVPKIPPAPAPLFKHAGLLAVLDQLRPFVGEDASRPWCASILFSNEAAYATNNVVVASIPLPDSELLETAVCALPITAVDELLRIDREPESVILQGTNALIFYLPGGVTLSSNLISEGWPDAGAILTQIHGKATAKDWVKIPSTLIQAVALLTPLCPDPKAPAIVLDGDVVRTRSGISTAHMGGFQRLAGTYHPKALEMVLAHATHAAWKLAPRVPWRGPGGLRGALVGLVA